MAHTKAGGSTNNNRDSVAKRLGVKVYGGQKAQNGSIVVRQKGTKFHPGKNVRLGKDYTIYSVVDGVVAFRTAKGKVVVDVVA